MVDLKGLEQLSGNNIPISNAQDLIDIQHVHIDTSLPALERLEKYMNDIQNPYHFLCDDLTVHICFSESGHDLSTHLKKYFSSYNR